ncbi:MAG: 2-amino-4-hydroxy-6-hydroxymethyldihydropteridine diphosphokinase [Alcanivoracaceae bacterium]|nr:2-amino-4-hydroxy-6-hydroxymethyldihydropteridine diphosphokinase [Alcanivoracaceae bacterium]
MTDAFIGLGSNLGDSVALLSEARIAIDQLAGCCIVAASSLYRSAPVGPQDQPDYFNAVLLIDTSMSAPALLAALQHLEQQAGRVRVRHWGERTLDLDILLYGGQVINQTNLQIPHPRLTERAFVLKPLLEISSHLTLPDGQSLAASCAATADQPICLHNDSRWSVVP